MNQYEIPAYLNLAPKDLPMTLAKFLQRYLPKVRSEDRAKAWKHFVNAHPPGSINVRRDGKDYDLPKIMATLTIAHSKIQIKDEDTYFLVMKLFTNWYPFWRASQTSKARSEAGKKPKKKI